MHFSKHGTLKRVSNSTHFLDRMRCLRRGLKWRIFLFILVLGPSLPANHANALILDYLLMKCVRALTGELRSFEETFYAKELSSVRLKIIDDPNYELSAYEQLRLQNLPQNDHDKLTSLRRTSSIMKKIKSLFASVDLMKEINPKKKEQRRVVEKILRHPESGLSENEMKALGKLADDVPYVRQVGRANGKVCLNLRRLRRLWKRMTVGLFAAGVLQQALPVEHISRAEYRQMAPLADNEFEIVFYSVHASVRVGSHEYDYMLVQARRDGLAEHYGPQESTHVRFRVDRPEVERLRSSLEHDVGSAGLYLTAPAMISTCVSNVNREVERNTSIMVPAGLDRSPLFTLEWFYFRKQSGDARIQRIYSIPQENIDRDSGNAITGPGDLAAASKVLKILWDTADAALTSVMLPDAVIAAQFDRTPWGYGLYYPRRRSR